MLYGCRTAGFISTARVSNPVDWNVLLIHSSLLPRCWQVRPNPKYFPSLNRNLCAFYPFHTWWALHQEKPDCSILCKMLKWPLYFQWRAVEKCHTLSRVPAVNIPEFSSFFLVFHFFLYSMAYFSEQPGLFQLSKVWFIMVICHYRSTSY